MRKIDWVKLWQELEMWHIKIYGFKTSYPFIAATEKQIKKLVEAQLRGKK